MTPFDTTHPDDSLLRAFDRGNVDETIARAIEEHLSSCLTCSRVLSRPECDSFVALVQTAANSAQDPAVPLRLQHGYEILKEIGRGGMGVVYQARQAGFSRIVALKRMHTDRSTRPEILARFRREATAAARLDHPNVVRIYDVGEQEGQPYLAMEYVAGGTLADNLTDPLPAQQAAELVKTLAGAIHAAHQLGIVHRDLKPSNVLLAVAPSPLPEDRKETTNPSALATSNWQRTTIPKISDFGLARLLDEEGAQTQTGEILGTPSYMAPEQASGQARAVGPAADVYSLGTILYEALTGRPPFKAATLLDTLEQVRTQEPVPPSRLQPKVPRDLETICLKCLDKRPERRYTSAAALGDDLHRFLTGQAIQARPVGHWERAWKWTRRRPAAATLIGVATLTLAFLLLGGWVVNVRLRAEQEVAERNIKNLHDAVLTLHWGVAHGQLVDVPGTEDARLLIYNEAVRLYKDSAQEGSRQNHKTICVQASVVWVLGFFHDEQGQRPLAQEHYEEASRLVRALWDEFPKESLPRTDWAQYQIDRGWFLDRIGRHRDAERTYREALDIMEAAPGGPAAFSLARAELAMYLAMRLARSGRPLEAEAAFHQARTLGQTSFESMPESDGKYNNIRDFYATLCLNEGQFLQTRDRSELAEARLREAVRLLEPIARDEQYLRRWQGDLARSYLALATTCQPDRLDEAEILARKALAIAEQLTRQFPRMDRHQSLLAQAQQQVAVLCLRKNQRTEAEQLLLAARTVCEKLAQKQPVYLADQAALAAVQNDLGRLSRLAGRFEEAARAHGQALALVESLAQNNPEETDHVRSTAETHFHLAELHQARQDAATARDHRVRAIQVLEDLHQKDPHDVRSRQLLDACNRSEGR